jgi:Rod binding domain-containing protein
MDLSSIDTARMSGGALGPGIVRPDQTPAQQRAAVAGQFEAIMLRQLLSESVGAMVGGDDSASGSIYGYMLTDVLSSKLAAGGGMGLSKMIARQLAPVGEASTDDSTSRPTLP